MNRALLVFLLSTLLADAETAQETTPSDPRYRTAWREFYYGGNSEIDIGSSLVRVGEPIVPSVCRAIADRNMRRRRYAIDALGWIGDRRAISSLQKILSDATELQLLRADALEAIYRISPSLAHRLSPPHVGRKDLLGTVARAVIADDKKWFEAPIES
jgi:HEAT repeat protein